ncbi:coiled-coil domain-containing protein 110-like [Heterodontus francisci]|uniref:coiled-coil domain-containing protein 110-like n=1 Tax=Heterodontus francisci TaxID=7792 RepID=UPI00355AE04B
MGSAYAVPCNRGHQTNWFGLTDLFVTIFSENLSEIRGMQFNPENALKVQSEINEIFNRSKLDASRHQFMPLQQSLTSNHENPQLLKARNILDGISSQGPHTEHQTSTEKSSPLHEVHAIVDEMNEGLIQNNNSLLQSSEDIWATLLPVSLLEELPIGNTSLQHTGNQTDHKTLFQVCDSSSAYHSAALSSISNLNSSPTKQAAVGHARSDVLLLQYNDESWAILEKICIASERMRLQPERSQKWELILGCELQRLRNVAKITREATGTTPTRTPQKLSLFIESLNLEIEVDNKSDKILELETMVIRLQNAMVSLEERNLDLHRELKEGSGSNSPYHMNHWSKTHNKTVIQNNFKNQKEEKINDFTYLQEKPVSSSNNELALLSKTSERPSLVCHMEKQKEYSDKLQKTMQLVEEKKDEVNAFADECTSWFPLSEYSNNMLNGLRYKDEKLNVQSAAEELTTNFDSVLQENAEYKSIVSQLEEERRTLQVQFIEMEEERKSCIEEIKALLSRHEDLQNQNQALEADKQQLINENESIKRLADKMMEEKEDLLAVIGAKETVLQLEKTKEAVEAINANVLQFENQKMNQSLNELKKEITFLKNELEKASCEIQCTKAKYAVMRTKNLMLFQLVQEVQDKNYKLEKSLQNSVTNSKSLQKEVDDFSTLTSTMKKKFLNETEQAKQGKSSPGNCPSDLVRKCEMFSKIVAILTEENKILNKDLEKYIKANLQLECTIRKLDEEWLLLGKHTGSIEQEINILDPERGKVPASYLTDGNNAVQLSRQGREDEMSDNQLNLSKKSFNSTGLSFGDDSRMALCSSPKGSRSSKLKQDETEYSDQSVHRYLKNRRMQQLCGPQNSNMKVT